MTRLVEHPFIRRGLAGLTGVAVAGVMVLTIAAGTVEAQMSSVSGAITYPDGKAIPEGVLKIQIEDLATGNAVADIGEVQIKSRGADKSVAFALPPLAAKSSGNLEIVARLERADGFLLARGSAPYEAGAPVTVPLSTVQY